MSSLNIFFLLRSSISINSTSSARILTVISSRERISEKMKQSILIPNVIYAIEGQVLKIANMQMVEKIKLSTPAACILRIILILILKFEICVMICFSLGSFLYLSCRFLIRLDNARNLFVYASINKDIAENSKVGVVIVNSIPQNYSLSIIPAIPCPPPTQAVTIPYFLSSLFRSFTNWMVSLQPVQPNG